MRHARRTIFAVMAAGLLSVVAATTAVGADSSGCEGSATSVDSTGATIQTVTAPGPSATQDDPFMVDYDGTVSWEGVTQEVIQDGSWTVTATPFSFSGEVTNDEGRKKGSGEISPDSYLPFAIPGLVLVTVDLAGADGAACSVSGWIQFTGNPLTSPAGWVAIGLSVLGALGMLLLLRMVLRAPEVPVSQNRFGRVVMGLLSGIVLGLGAAALLVMYGVMALGTMTPVIVVGGSMALGFVLGLLPRRGVAT